MGSTPDKALEGEAHLGRLLTARGRKVAAHRCSEVEAEPGGQGGRRQGSAVGGGNGRREGRPGRGKKGHTGSSSPWEADGGGDLKCAISEVF
jgi:hypothetical protein